MTTPSLKTARIAIGNLADRLWEDESWAWSQLKNADWRVRYFSFVALTDAGQLTPDEAFGICKSLATTDPSEKLVINLLGKLGHAYSGTFNSEASCFLAQIASDAYRPNAVRLQAFFALEDINTTKQSLQTRDDSSLDHVGDEIELIEFRLDSLRSQSLEVVDSDWVRQFLTKD